ncbi:MAG: TetR/AcrR family transcriptional regulator [Acidimicrobiales bacterium]|nr:TetR/AcrR family transcriptional regulator [Acidimicrobiales bacterium]
MTGTRERILDATAELFRIRGYCATGMKQVVARAEAPFGSVYHFFPGGKEQLAAESIERAGRHYHDLVLAVFDAEPDVIAGTRAVFDGAGEVLRTSGYADACPIATVALEVASTSEPLRHASDRVFESWLASLRARLVAAGVDAATARSVAISVVALLEGAFLLSRTARTTEAMAATGDAAVALVEAALAG